VWGIDQFDHLADFFTASQQIGVEQFVLNHKVSSAILAGLDLTRYRIGSVHEPRPADISGGTLDNRN